jgi:transcriptional regulator with XRE-family HTH domain
MKYNSTNFKNLLHKKLGENGLSIQGFAIKHGFSRSPLMRALSGAVKPSAESLEKWCQALECSPEERRELYKSVGYYTPEELAAERELGVA